MAQTFSIWVDYHTRGINIFTGDLFEPYQFGQYATCMEAQAACRQLLDEFLVDCAQPGVGVAEIMAKYTDEGVNPKIVHSDGSPAPCLFVPAVYALHRARELAGDLWLEPDAFCEPAETSLSSAEIIGRLQALAEPRTFVAHPDLDCVVRLPTGASVRFHREGPNAPLELSAAVPRRAPYRAKDRLWDRAAALLAQRTPMELALETLREARQSNDTCVDLSGHGLTSLPPELWTSFTAITQLNLGDNWLRNLPPELARLSRLESLNVSNNLLTELPPELSQLHNLRVLNASGNLLKAAPVCSLGELVTLNLSSNRLSALPADIWRLACLETLRLDRNELTAIPPQISNLSRLRKLTLDHNRLRDLPPELSRLKHLKDFDELDKKHLPAPDELHGITATGNALTGPASGRLLLNDLAAKLRQRVTAVPWHIRYSEPFSVAFKVAAPATQTEFPGPPKTIQFKAHANRCLYSLGARQLAEPLDPAKLEQTLERMEAEQPEKWVSAIGRRKLALGRTPGLEHALPTPAGVLRLHTYLTTTHLYQAQVEGPAEMAFSAESDAYLDSVRFGPFDWRDHLLECRIQIRMAANESLFAQALRKSLPAIDWSEGDSSWDKIRVWGETPNTYIRVYRYEEPGPFELTIRVRAPEGWGTPEVTIVHLRDTVLQALRATLWKPLEPQDVPLVRLGDGRFPYAYAFACDLSLSGMQALLDDAQFWSWQMRNGSLEGHVPFHIDGQVKWAHPHRVRISGETPRYRIDVGNWTDESGWTPTCAEIHQTVQNTLLPALGARDVSAY